MESEPDKPVRNSGIDNLTPWKPGQSGNPAGRPSAGLSVIEHMNAMSASGLCEDDLRKIAKDKSIQWNKRTAANRMLRTLEVGDLADYSDFIRGTKTLEKLREEGVNTEMVKKIKRGKLGIEVELHDRAGENFDRILDRTEGKPRQAVEVSGPDAGPIQTETKYRFDHEQHATLYRQLVGGRSTNGDGRGVDPVNGN